MDTQKTLDLIDSKLEPLKDHLIQLYGDEHNDIGDAGNAAELLGNTLYHMNPVDHSSYERPDFYREVASFLEIDSGIVFKAVKEMEDWEEQEWSASGAWIGGY